MSNNNNGHIKVTELDPLKIKEALREYFSREESPYNDWNFDSSALDLQLSVLAYNTHMNSMLANTGFNESFIESAQLRKNLVSNARTLGYVPRSRRAATIDVKLRYFYNPDSDAFTQDKLMAEPRLHKGATFSTTNDLGQEVLFITAQDYTGTPFKEVQGSDGFIPGYVTFPNSDSEYVRLYQGQFKEESFVADASIPNQRFRLSGENIDTSTLAVVINGLPYQEASSLNDLSRDSLVYFIDETDTGRYEIYFGNNVLGAKIPNLADVQVTYIVTDGIAGNDLSTFEHKASSLNNSGELEQVPPAIDIEEGLTSGGGSERETMSSIRFNAPKSFITQNRAVTVQDYKNVILKELGGNLHSVSVWGGDLYALGARPAEDSFGSFERLSGESAEEARVRILSYIDSSVVGTAYITAIDSDKQPINDSLQTRIEELIDDKRVFTVKTKFIEAVRTDIVPTLIYRYDPVRFSGSLSEQTIALRSAINDFSAENIDSFDTRFNVSKFYTSMDASSLDILSTFITSLKLRSYVKIYASPAAVDVTLNMPECSSALEDFGQGALESSRSWDLSSSAFTDNPADTPLTEYRASPNYVEHLVDSTFFTGLSLGDDDTAWSIRDRFSGVANERDLYLYKVNFSGIGSVESYSRIGAQRDVVGGDLKDSIGKINRNIDGTLTITFYGTDKLSASSINRLSKLTNAKNDVALNIAVNTADVKYTLNSYGSVLGDQAEIVTEKV